MKDKKINLCEGETYDIAIKVNRRRVVVVSQTKTSIKVCCDYRTEGKERWKPIYCWISKKSILGYKKVEKNKYCTKKGLKFNCCNLVDSKGKKIQEGCPKKCKCHAGKVIKD